MCVCVCLCVCNESMCITTVVMVGEEERVRRRDGGREGKRKRRDGGREEEREKGRKGERERKREKGRERKGRQRERRVRATTHTKLYQQHVQVFPLTANFILHSLFFQSFGLYLICAPSSGFSSGPTRYTPMGTVPSHHCTIPEHCDNGTT